MNLLTFNIPSSVRVYCNPILRISLKTVAIISDQIAIGLGKVTTIAREIKIVVHTKPERRVSKSEWNFYIKYLYCKYENILIT